MTRIAVLVVSYRSADEVEPFIASLEGAASPGVDVEVHVIENSDDEASVATLSGMSGITRFVPSGANVGYGGGMNALAKTLEGHYDWLLVSNPDVRFSPGSIDELVAAGERHPRAGLVGPLILGTDGAVYPSARAFPSIRTGVGHSLFANIWAANPWTARYHRGGGDGAVTETEVDWLSGACLLVRPDAFTQVDGFDDGYFMYFEDVDLGWRLAKRGWSAVYAPAARILHSGAHSTSTQADLMRRVHHESANRYLGKRYAGPLLAPVRGVLRIGLFLRARLSRH